MSLFKKRKTKIMIQCISKVVTRILDYCIVLYCTKLKDVNQINAFIVTLIYYHPNYTVY